MTKCLNYIEGCFNEAYCCDGEQWAKCLDCLRKSYVPKSLKDNLWYNQYKKYKKKHAELLAHHKKMMRRFSIRTQRYKSPKFSLHRLAK